MMQSQADKGTERQKAPNKHTQPLNIPGRVNQPTSGPTQTFILHFLADTNEHLLLGVLEAIDGIYPTPLPGLADSPSSTSSAVYMCVKYLHSGWYLKGVCVGVGVDVAAPSIVPEHRACQNHTTNHLPGDHYRLPLLTIRGTHTSIWFNTCVSLSGTANT